MNLNDLQSKIHQTAVEHGWWEPQEVQADLGEPYGMGKVTVQRTFGELLALVHSEVSEALEAYRENGTEEWFEWPEDDRLPIYEGGDIAAGTAYAKAFRDKAAELGISPKPKGAFTELGDAIIRILDMAGFYGVDMQEIIERKMAYNETRSHRHGGKKL